MTSKTCSKDKIMSEWGRTFLVSKKSVPKWHFLDVTVIPGYYCQESSVPVGVGLKKILIKHIDYVTILWYTIHWVNRGAVEE